jgi:electron transport complex protein RnfA
VSYIGVLLTFVFVNNFVFIEFLGLCPALEGSRKTSRALPVGFWMSFLMTFSAAGAWLAHHYLLVPLGLGFLQTFVFLLIVVGLARGTEELAERFLPGLHGVLRSYGTFVSSNCAVLGIALLVARAEYRFFESVVAGLAAGIGIVLAMLLLATMREKLDRESVPRAFRGMPITFISTGLAAMAFLAFDRALLANLVG